MSAFFSLCLAPLALVFRMAHAAPWAAIGISALAGVVTHFLGYDGWSVLFASFMAYMMIWIDEQKSRPSASAEVE